MKLKEKTNCKHWLEDKPNPIGWCAKYNGDPMCNGCTYYRKKEVNNESMEQKKKA